MNAKRHTTKTLANQQQVHWLIRTLYEHFLQANFFRSTSQLQDMFTIFHR